MSEFNFNLKQAEIYKSLRWEKILCIRTLKKLRKVLLALFVVFLILYFLRDTFLALAVFSFCLSIIMLLIEVFFNTKLKSPRILKKENIAEFLSFETAKAVKKSSANSNLLFYFLLTGNPKLNFIFSRALLNMEEIKKRLKEDSTAVEEGFQKVILEALKRAQDSKREKIEIGDILVGLSKHNPIFQKILVENDLKNEDIENLVWWLENLEKRQRQAKRFWEPRNLAKLGTLGKAWTSGYTITLDEYAFDITETIKRTLPEIIGHEKEISAVEVTLSRSKINNVLLVGESGTGRKSIIEGLAFKSFLGETTEAMDYKRFMALDMASLLAKLQDPEIVEKTLNNIFQEATSAGNIILVIDEFHNYISRKSGPGIVDISGILGSYLHLPQFQIIAITTYSGLHKNIEQNPSILDLLEKVEVAEISKQELLQVLENLCLSLERKHKILVSQPALREIISLTDRYLPNLPFPKKAMDTLDEVMSFVAASTKDKLVLPSHVAKVVEKRTEIPVGKLTEKEKNLLLNLEQLFHKRIVNQEEAVRELSESLRRARAEITIRKGPIGAFLFLGPTGVGKTETAKALAQIYFGSEKKMMRLDMSEFQDVKDIARLIGKPGQEGRLSTPMRENPFSLLLLDEIEKAHPNVLNLFLQVLDDGHLTDGQGRKVSFKNAIIIATSNAGYKVILQALKEKTNWQGVKQKLLDELFRTGLFRPEFINRFDAMVVFKPLSKENLLDIASLLLGQLKKNLKEKNIELTITEPLKEKIAELGYNPTFGAREMRRVIQDKVENVLARAILEGKIKKGDSVEVSPEGFELTINN